VSFVYVSTSRSMPFVNVLASRSMPFVYVLASRSRRFLNPEKVEGRIEVKQVTREQGHPDENREWDLVEQRRLS
jgi:hypothetical protein